MKSKISYIGLFQVYDSSKVVNKKMLHIKSFLLDQYFEMVLEGKKYINIK